MANVFTELVLSNFFQPFYAQRIVNVRNMDTSIKIALDLSTITFWFSVIDFYGGIYYVGKFNKVEPLYRTRKRSKDVSIIRLAHADAFIQFVKDFFPSSTRENELGSLLYSLFRTGIVHQLSPKRGVINWEHGRSELLWIDIDSKNIDVRNNKTISLNIYRLEELAFKAYLSFKKHVENESNVEFCENICNHLILQNDGLQDGFALDYEYSRLDIDLQNLLTRFK